MDEVLNTTPAQAQVVEIKDSIRTPGSDRLTNYGIKGLGWTVISSNINQTDTYFGDPRYQPGAKVIYISTDSLLPVKLEQHLFPFGSKIVLKDSRVRVLKIRGAYSYGMFLDIEPQLKALYPEINFDKLRVGDDVSELLGITKFEPPLKNMPSHLRGKMSKKNKHFVEYSDIRHLKHYAESDVFQQGEEVYCSVKLHGSSVRFACVPTHCNTLWKKIKKFFRLLPPYETCFGSRRCQFKTSLRAIEPSIQTMYIKRYLKSMLSKISLSQGSTYSEKL